MEKICPRCGVSFVCRPDKITDCQCAPVKLDNFQRTYIRDVLPRRLFVWVVPG